MRKVLFQKWIDGVKTPKYAAYKGSDYMFNGTRYEDGTGIYTDMENVGYFHGFIEGPHGEPVAHIEHQGQMINVDTYRFKFTDTPEDEQVAEFAKAILQGMLSNNEFASLKDVDSPDGNELIKVSVKAAYDLIAELKKQKP